MLRVLACSSLLVALISLGGCGLGSSTPELAKASIPAAAANGSVNGGQQPITGATIQLYAVGTTGFGSAGTPLISATVTTSDGTSALNSNANAGNANNSLPAGQFTITGDYTCPTASTLVYVMATGGNPGLGGTVNNTASILLAPLGQCGSLSPSTFVSLNELTTAAAVENLSAFLSANGSIGSPSDAVSQQALSNAFSAVSKMVNISTGAAQSGFPKLATLANAMVPCVNSTGPASSSCTTLFTDATPSGGTAPTTVLGSLLNIALNPTLNTSAIYNLSTANAPFQPALTSTPGFWNITTAGANVSACGVSSPGDTVTGTVTYSGSKTGRIYIAINNNSLCDVGTEGTSIAGPGTFTIHGVPPGNYTLQAFMDTQGYGSINAANPMGVSSSFSVNAPTTFAPTFSISETTPVLAPPGISHVAGINGGAIVLFKQAKTPSGYEGPTSYTLQWSTSPTMTPIAGSKTFPAVGGNTSIWFVNGLTDGSIYYFNAYSSAGGSNSSAGTAVGPFTIGAPSAGSSVSGSVSFTGAATGPMFVGYYNQDSETVAPYIQTISSPVSQQAYSFFAPNSASAVYLPVVLIDQNNDGVFDAGDLNNLSIPGGPYALTGTTTNQNFTVPAGNVFAHVVTQAILSGGTTKYGVQFILNFQAKQPVAVTLLNSYNSDGANIDSGPLDLANCSVPGTNCNGSSGFQIYFNFNATAPTAGDTYLFNVTYSDGTSETVPVQISNVLTAFATNLAPQTGGSTSGTPTFTWTDPVCADCSTYTYRLYINDSSGNGVWSVPGTGNGLAPGTTSLTWPTDPTQASNTPTLANLSPAVVYSWAVTVQDSNYNQATSVVSYQP